MALGFAVLSHELLERTTYCACTATIQRIGYTAPALPTPLYLPSAYHNLTSNFGKLAFHISNPLVLITNSRKRGTTS
jgi:hypothetical protein